MIFDEYSNVLRCMYNTRFNGCTVRSGTSTEAHSTFRSVTPSLISTLETGRPNKFRRRKDGSKEASDTKFNNLITPRASCRGQDTL